MLMLLLDKHSILCTKREFQFFLLWDEQNSKVAGMLTASDFILILLQLHSNRATLTDEEIEEHTISAWKDLKFRQHREVIGASEPLYGRALIQAGPDESLKDVALRILQNKISAVPILSTTQDGSCPHLLFIACLSGILKHICRHFRRHIEYLPLLQQPVGNLPLGTWARKAGKSNGLLLTLRASDPLSSALNLLIQAQISSVPIVDDNGILVDVYCRSDITSLANNNVYAHLQHDQTIISQFHNSVQLIRVTPSHCRTFNSDKMQREIRTKSPVPVPFRPIQPRLLNHVNDTHEVQNQIICEIVQECPDKFRKKLDEALIYRTQLVKALANAKLECTNILSALSEGTIPPTSGSIKEQLDAITLLLKEGRQIKEKRIKEFSDMQSKIQDVWGEITGTRVEKEPVDSDFGYR